MNFLLAPFYSLFSLSLYRRIAKAGVGKGISYLLYLSAIATFVASIFFVQHGLSEVNSMLDWVKSEMPEMTFTPEGLSINAQSPYTIVHPRLGPLATFDMTKTDIQPETIGNVMIFVTSKKVYFKQANQIKGYDLSRGQTTGPPYLIKITKEYLDRIYISIKPWLALSGAFLFFLFFFFWKLLAALFYSWFGLLINFLRRPKLNYGAIFNISLFALTPAAFIQGACLFMPAAVKFSFGFLGSFLVTVAYLVFAIKGTQEKNAEG